MTTEKTGFSLRIFHRILLTMVIVALIPLAGLLYIGGYQLQRDWRLNVNQSLRLTAEGLAAKANGWTEMNLRALRESAALPDVMSMDGVRQRPVLKTVQSGYEWAYLVFTVRPDGQNVARSDDNPLVFYGDRGYFKQAIGGQPLGQEVLIGRTSGKPALILAAPIRGADAQPAGVIAFAMHLVDVSQAVVGTRIGSTGYAILVDDKNRVIAHGRPEKVSQALQDLSSHPALRMKESAQEPVVFEEGGGRVVAFTTRTALGWTLIVQQDHDEAFAPLLESNRNALILTACALLLVIGVAYALSAQLARPIRELTEVAEGISRGDFGSKVVGTDRRDEIGALARAIERMAVSIRMAFDRLRKRA
jgi:methyl-accepting chemotaxis protein